MPRKAFFDDLKDCSSNTYECILRIRRGPDDGEIELLLSDGSDDGGDFKVFLFAPDVSDYPTAHDFHVYAADNAPAVVAKALDKRPNLFGLTLDRVFTDMSFFFTKVFAGVLGEDSTPQQNAGHMDIDDDGNEADAEDDDDEEAFQAGIENEDWIFSDADGPPKQPPQTSNSNAKASNWSDPPETAPAKARADLLQAKMAGFKVGLQGSLHPGCTSIVSIAYRVRKLGISKEAMDAWQLKPNEYVILLIRYQAGYVDPLDKIKEQSSVNQNKFAGSKSPIQMRICAGDSYKPASFQEAEYQFLSLHGKDESRGNLDASDAPPATSIRKTFISEPLENFMNGQLLSIISYRVGRGYTWDEAETFVYENQGRTLEDANQAKERGATPKEQPNLPKILRDDALQEARAKSTRISFPLVAEQFLLRHFVRCTDFCLVCHRRVSNNIDAIKPYICESDLCLFQYMALGFGVNIEDEIVRQPYVVDLLVSFCYTAAAMGKLEVFPRGLNLRVCEPISLGGLSKNVAPALGAKKPGQSYWRDSAPAPPTPPVSCTYDISLTPAASQIQFTNYENGQQNIAPGDWVIVKRAEDNFLCKVLETDYLPTLKVQVVPSVLSNGLSDFSSIPEKACKASLFCFQLNFDDLTPNLQRQAIIDLLDLLPNVKEMREYLLKDHRRKLSDWKERIPPAACSVLRWIITSNRSCIVQLDQLGIAGEKRSVINAEDRVQGVTGWIQFHFMTGSPTKETRFIDSIAQNTASKPFPTMFAWHGSPTHNWHSIIREGLHFKEVTHGRAFGNGCYHSKYFTYSICYSGRSVYNLTSHSTLSTWTGSLIKPDSAMALNEIVNAPSAFVSQEPHYVVDKVDWIQTRYLFVRPTTEVITPKDISTARLLLQDPLHTPVGPYGEHIKIPVTAVPKSRRPRSQTESPTLKKQKLSKGKHPSNPVVIDDEDDSVSVATDIEDIEILAESKARTEMVTTGTATRTEVAAPKAAKIPAEPSTLFNVQSLAKCDGAKLLPMPSYATHGATKRLQKDLASMIALQNQHIEMGNLAELGWYISEDHVIQTNNIYQWIVHLHSFPLSHQLGKDMQARGAQSIVLEIRFPGDYPIAPPFIRVVTPRFLPLQAGGGGHVTSGGSICMELLTNSGWGAAYSVDSVLLQIRVTMLSTEPRPARLEKAAMKTSNSHDYYGVSEAVAAFRRVAQTHGWTVDASLKQIEQQGVQ